MGRDLLRHLLQVLALAVLVCADGLARVGLGR